jgi:flagellar hook-basal body complex protein FliE
MSDMNVDQVLSQMRAMSIEASSSKKIGIEGSVKTGDSLDFGDILKQSIDSVNETQQTSATLSKSFEVGDPDTSLAEVMIASQKASVSFQAMLQVRNKLTL